jgi:hypothetical protein
MNFTKIHMSKYLQSFLDAGLFELGDKDERMGFLEKTATALAAKLKSDKQAIVHHTLLLIGKPVASDETLLNEIETAIKENGWKSFKQIYPDRCLPIIQAIVLESLTKVMTDSPIDANLIWLAACDRLNAVEGGRQKELILSFFLKARDAVEKLAEAEWTVSHHSKYTLASDKIEPPQVVAIPRQPFPQELFRAAFGKALGAIDANGTQYPNGNQYPPFNQNNQVTGNWPNWINSFAEIGGAEVANLLNQGNTKQAEQIETAIQKLQAFVVQVATHNQKNIQEFLKGQQEISQKTAQNAERRGQLLWWKTAKYSPTLMQGYRQVSSVIACISIAQDLSGLCGAITPLSMDYFLREAVREVIGKDEDGFSINHLFHLISQEADEEFRKATFGPIHVLPESRVLGDFLYNDNKDSDCQILTGIDPEQQLTWEDFTVWHFHYLQLQKNLPQE